MATTTASTPSTFPYYSTRHFCLYKKEPSDIHEDQQHGEEAEVSVSVVATDLDSEEQKLLNRAVVQKATKNLIYKSGSIHTIPRGNNSPPPSPPNTKGPVLQLVCFMALLELAGEHLDAALVGDEGLEDEVQGTSREYYICFLCESDSDHSLSLFHAELKKFSEQLIPLLQKHNADEEQEELKSSISQMASSWYWKCVEYITRCVRLLAPHLDVVMHSILLGKQVVIVAPPPLFEDLSKLLLDVSIVNLTPSQVPRDDEAEELAPSDDDVAGRLVIMCARPAAQEKMQEFPPDYSDIQVTLSSRETNSFCASWADKLRNAPFDAFQLRTLLEDLKLRVIQELNFIRKIIDQAKLSNYLLYKSYLVLRSNNNCDVLLSLLMKDITNDITTTEVLEVISEYIQDAAMNEQAVKATAGAGHVF